MAKFYGPVGYAVQEEIRPGVWSAENIREVNYRGDVNYIRFRQENPSKVNDDIVTSDEISIVADPFAFENFSNIRYVEYMGVRWNVSNVQIRRPRIILSLGGVYNGGRPSNR